MITELHNTGTGPLCLSSIQSSLCLFWLFRLSQSVLRPTFNNAGEETQNKIDAATARAQTLEKFPLGGLIFSLKLQTLHE